MKKEIPKDIMKNIIQDYSNGISIRTLEKKYPYSRYVISQRLKEHDIKITKNKDITNQRFGKLIALKNTGKIKQKSYIWKCQCDCGNTIYVSVSELTRTLNGTKSCGCIRNEKIQQQGYKNTNITIGQKFGLLTVLEKTNRRHGRIIIWKCKCDCGNIAYVSSTNLNSGHTKSCGCIKSKGERKVQECLQLLKINFIKEYRFLDCKDIKPLPFDFYLPDYNCCIEYDGEQHFKNHRGYTEDRKKKDNIKTKYCLDNNINLIRIPYYDYNKLNISYINDLLSEEGD